MRRLQADGRLIVSYQTKRGVRTNEYIITCCRLSTEEREAITGVSAKQIKLGIEKEEAISDVKIDIGGIILKDKNAPPSKKKLPKSQEPRDTDTERMEISQDMESHMKPAIEAVTLKQSNTRNPRLVALSSQIQADYRVLAEERARRATMPKITESNAQELMEAMKLPA